MANEIIPHIGRKIKFIRQKEELTLQNLAEQSGVTKGLISKIENGRVIPSLPVLLNIIQALNVELEEFFTGLLFGSSGKFIHVKHKDFVKIDKEGSARGYSYFNIINSSFNSNSIDVSLLNIKPGSTRQKLVTEAFELKYLISGSLDYHIEDNIIKLEKGDALFYDGRLPHSPINRSNVEANLLVIYFFNS